MSLKISFKPDFFPKKVELKGISAKDYMNLILVQNDLKPAAIFDYFVPEKEYYKKINTKIDEGISLMEELGLDYFIKIRDRQISTRAYEEKEFTFQRDGVNVNFYASKNIDTLTKLLETKNDEVVGECLGYPEECINSYIGKKGPEIKYYDIEPNIWKSVISNVPLPSWFAYINHVPEKFDLINNDISKSSEDLGLKYQKFIRKNHPEISSVIEKNFYNYYSKDNIVWTETSENNK